MKSRYSSSSALAAFTALVLLLQLQVPLLVVGQTPAPTTAAFGAANATGTVAPRNNSTPAPSTAPGTAPSMPTLPPATPCSTSLDCKNGTFCSSLTSTCIELNCTNWREGAPAGEPLYSETPCPAKVTDGVTQSPGFCGRDGECHDYGCQNWYLYGPVAFTGFNPASPVNLTCEDYSTGSKDNMNGVVYGCRPYTPEKPAPKSKTVVSFFNQKCSAAPSQHNNFECYDYKQSTDFQPYQQNVARENPPSCNQQIYQGLTTQPLYWYNVIMLQLRNGNSTYLKVGRENTLSTSQFDPNDADKAMFAKLVATGPVPNFPNTTPAPTPTSAAPNGDFAARKTWSRSFMASLVSATAILVVAVLL